MEAYIVEWLNLLGRWLHMITGIAWIGASFYFVWLDNHLETPKSQADQDKGVGGELWAVHGGGFYHAQKYKVSPAQLPENLHWFKWEAYTTWLSGMFMLILMYWYGAEIYTIDPNVMALSKPVAIMIGVGVLVLGWVVYDLLCKSSLGKDDNILAAVLLVFVTVVAFGLTQVFSGRGAYIHYGAMLGTIMVANVAMVIMPGQRAMVANAEKGLPPDPAPGLKAKQRSVHNTYFTLPVLFVMISNHYAGTYGSQWNWLVLVLISLAGALIRVYFVQRHFGRNKPMIVMAALVFLAISAAILAPKPVETSAVVDDVTAFAIVEQRCASCHAAAPTQPGFSAAPKGVLLDSIDAMKSQAVAVHQQTVVSRAMPIGNLTQITEEERARLAAWFQSLEK